MADTSRVLLLAAVLASPLLPPDAAAAATEEDGVLTTSDGARIAYTLTLPDPPARSDAEIQRAPAVVLIHQGGSTRGEWRFMVRPMTDRGWAVLAYDVRGHGQSSKVADISALFNDPRKAPKDLEAILALLREHPAIDPQRIAVVGSSIGSNLACVASSAMGVKSAVAVSGKTSAVDNLAGKHKQNLALKSVFHISSAGDQGGARAGWARELYERTAEPRRITIVEGSAAHGVGIFRDDPELAGEVLAWLEETL